MYGLVLEGGGTKGSYQIGVFKAINELQLPIKAITGTSIGALNGAMFAQGRYEDAYKLWTNINPGMVFNTDIDIYTELINFDFKSENIKKYYNFIHSIVKESGLNIEPLRELIKDHLDETLLRNSEIDFGLVTVSVTDFKPMMLFVDDIPEGQLHDYILASAYLPGFKNEPMNGKRFVDGGLYDNAPINMIIQKEIDDIIVVRLKGIGFTRPIQKKDIILIEISPSEDLGSFLNFDEDQAKHNMDLGYYDALRVLKYTKTSYYCIGDIPDEDYFMEMLLQVDDDTILSIADEIGLDIGYPRRVLLESIMPQLCELFGCKKEHSYRTVILYILEKIALTYHVERLKLYEYDEFIETLVHIKVPEDKEIIEYDDLPSIIKKSTLVRKIYKNSLYKKLLSVFVKSHKKLDS